MEIKEEIFKDLLKKLDEESNFPKKIIQALKLAWDNNQLNHKEDILKIIKGEE